MAFFKKKKKSPGDNETKSKDEKKDEKKEEPIYDSAMRLLTAEGWRRRMKKK